MKISLTTSALAVAALLAGSAMAGNSPGPGGDGPHGIMRADTNGDGKVSRDEAAALQDKAQADWFDKTDADHDGFVTEDEVRKARDARREHMRGDMKVRMEERFQEADINKDGQLSLDEAQAKMPRLAERFNTLDADKNGTLSKDELKRGGPRRAPQN